MGGRDSDKQIKLVFYVSIFEIILIPVWTPKF